MRDQGLFDPARLVFIDLALSGILSRPAWRQAYDASN
jgi:hypothetical protein